MHKSRIIMKLCSLIPCVIFITACVQALVEQPVTKIEAPLPKEVLSINGQSIGGEEFLDELFNHRQAVIADHQTRFGAEIAIDRDFWSRRFEGVTPEEVATKRALEALLERTVKLQLAKQHGFISDIDYSSIQMKWRVENERRASTTKVGDPIYGPINYTLDQYYKTTLDRLMFLVERKRSETVNYVDEASLRAYYENIREDVFNRGALTEVKLIRLSFVNNQWQIDEERKKTAHKQLVLAVKQLSQGMSFDELSAQLNESGKQDRLRFDPAQPPKRDRIKMVYYLVAQKLQPDEISNIVETDDAYALLQCITREELGIRPFSEVKEVVRNLYMKNEFDYYIRNEITSAKIVINDDAVGIVLSQFIASEQK